MRWIRAALIVPVLALAALAGNPGVKPDGCCAPATAVVCVATDGAKSVSHTRYRVKCDIICLPFCRLLGLCHQGCGPCGQPREVRRLLKKIVKEDVCETKCVPVTTAAEACPVAAPCPARP